jgi:hypothetical protein
MRAAVVAPEHQTPSAAPQRVRGRLWRVYQFFRSEGRISLINRRSRMGWKLCLEFHHASMILSGS